MRQWIFTLVFGADEIAQKMFQILTLRTQAIARHTANKSLEVVLATGKKELGELKDQYAETKIALESAYRLDLD